MTLLQQQLKNLVDRHGYATVRRALVEVASQQLDAEHAALRLPKGVTVVGLSDPEALHNAIAKELGE